MQTLLRCPYIPRVQPHALTSMGTLKIPQSLSEFGGLKTPIYPALKARIYSECTVEWVARLCRSPSGKANPNFPWEKSPMGQCSCKSKVLFIDTTSDADQESADSRDIVLSYQRPSAGQKRQAQKEAANISKAIAGNFWKFGRSA